MTNEQPTQVQMIHLTIDGKEIEVPKGTTVYTAAKQMGVDIPIFCYLDRMPPFGACRMCLVEIEKMPKPQTSCTLEVAEGMVVNTQTDMAVNARKEIIEFLLLNHPLDCPICDRGGECPLQDNAMKNGPGKSRFYEEKRHFRKPLPLGPVLMLDRERCIVCARCTRFSDILSGDHALEFIERGYKTEVGTPDGQPAESKYIGNTIMICPVGALTSQVYRFRARPWDNEPTESTCTLCPVGCSMILDSRDGEIMRTRSRENHDVNDIWLCDKGWFGYEFSYHPERLTTPLIKRNGKFEKANWEEAVQLIVNKIQEAKPRGKLAALGGLPLTFEENYLFQKLIREVMGVNHLDYRVGLPNLSSQDEGIPPGMEMSIGDCEKLHYVILLGLDLTEEFPVIWLRLRQAINHGASAIFAGNFAPEIATYFTKTIIHSPGEELQTLEQLSEEISLLSAKGKGALLVGSQYLANPNRLAILSQLTRWQKEAPNLSLNIMEGRGNSRGARWAGMHPEFKPFGEKLSQPGMNAEKILEVASKNEWDFLYIAGANPALKIPSKQWGNVRKNLGFLLVQDLFLTETAKQADVVLPTLSFVEKGGSFINIEGRVQSLLPGKEIPQNVYDDGQIFMLIAKHLNFDLILEDRVSETLNEKIPLHRENQLFENQFPIIHVDLKENEYFAVFTYALFDRGVRMKHDPHLNLLAKEPFLRLNSDDGKQLGLQEGDFLQVSANGASISAKVKLDAKIAKKTLLIPLGFADKIAVHELGLQSMNGLRVQVAKVQEI